MSKPDAGAADNGRERKTNKHRRPRVSGDSEPSTATGTRRGSRCGDHRRGEGVNERIEMRGQRSKEDGHSMSKKEKHGKTDPASTTTAVDAARVDRCPNREDTSTPPGSPSTTSRGGDSDGTLSPLLRQQTSPVVASVEDRHEYKERRKSNQPRDPPSRPPKTSPHARTSKDKKSSISFDRQHKQRSSQGWPTDEGVGLAEPVVSPATPKRRKRSRSSSRTLSVDHCDEIDPLEAQISPARRPTSKSICTNATSSSSRDGVRTGVARAPSQDSAAAIDTARGSTVDEDNHLEHSGKTAAADGTQESSKPAAFDVIPAHGERHTNDVDEEDETCDDRILQPRGRTSNFGEDETLEKAYDGQRERQAVTHPAEPRARRSSATTTATDVVRNNAPEKETGSTDGRMQGEKRLERHKGRRRQEGTRERKEKNAGTPGVSRKHQGYSDGGTSRKQETGDPSPVLDVKVIDRGATKHLVLTAGDITEGKPERSERSRGTATSSANGNRSSRTHDWQRREQQQQQQQLETEKERDRAFRDRLAVQGSGDVVEPPPGAQRERETTRKETNSGRGGGRRTLPPRPLMVAENQHPESEYHGSRLEAPSKGLPLAAAVDSLSVREDDTLGGSSPAPATVAPVVSVGETSWDASPVSSGASSFPGEPAPERTARYVQQQASFHAEVSDNFIDQNSPIGEGADGWSQRRTMPTVDASRPVAQHVTTAAETRAPDRSAESNETHQRTNPLSSPKFTGWANGGRQDAREGTKTRKQRIVPDELTSPDSFRPASHELLDVAPPRQAFFRAEALPEDGIRGDLGPHLRCRASPVSRERSDSSEAERSDERLSADRSSVKSEVSRGLGLHRFRTDVSRNLLSGERPALFFLRPNEGLAVKSVEGVGRLLVTLREEAGDAVLVDGAVVHDSAAHFGNTAVQTDHRFPYVAGHRYEFKAVPAQGVELALRGRDRNETAASEGSATATLAGLNVVFSVMSAYTETARLCSADADRFSLPAFEAPGSFPPKAMPSEKVDPPTSTFPEERGLTRQPPSRNPSPGDRPPSVSVAAALIAPCLSPSPGTEYQTTGTDVQTVAPKPAATTSAAASRAQVRTPLDNDNGTAGGRRGRIGEGGRGEVLAHAALDERNGDPRKGVQRLGQRQSGSGVDAAVLRDKPRYDAINCERPSRHPSSVPMEAGSNTNGTQDCGEWAQRTDGRCPDVVPRGGDLRAPPSGAEMVGQPSSGTFRSPHREKVVRAPIGDHSMGRLGWNPAWERQQPPPAAATPGVIPLPRIRSHVETSPRSAFGHMDFGENRTPPQMAVAAGEIRDSRPRVQRRQSMAGVDNEARNYPHRDPTPEAHHYGYDDRPARMQHHRPQQYRRGLNEVGRTQALERPGRDERCGRAPPHAEGDRRTLEHSAPEEVRLGPVAARGGPAPGWRYERRASEGEESRVDRRRWREDEGWTRGGRPELTRTLAGHDPGAGDDYQWAAEGPNGDPRRHRFHHRRRAASLSDSSRGGAFPPSVESRWEAGAPSDSRRVERGIRGGGGREGAVSLEEPQAFKRGDHPEALAMNRMKPRGNNQERRGGEAARYNDDYGTKKTAQRVRHAGYEPAAYRNPRPNIGSSVTQIGVGDDPGRTPPRWIKF